MSYNAQSMLLAAALNSREVFEQIEHVTLTDEGTGLLRAMARLYEGDAAALSLERSAVEAVLRAHCHDDKVADGRAEYLHSLPTETDGSARVLLHEIRLKNKRLELVDALLRDVPPEDLPVMLEEYAVMLDGTDSGEHDVSLEDLLTSVGDKVAVKPEKLNAFLNGGIHAGQTVMIFGRPGAAKTLLCVEMVAGLANKGKRGIYIGNEESGNTLLLRFLSRMGGESLSDLDNANADISRETIQRAHAAAMRRGLQNISIVHGVTNFSAVLKLVKERKPDFIVLDQLRHMNTGGDGLTQQMEASMRALRATSTKHSMIGICVSQAGASAHNKAVLSMNDLDSSKTGTQGAVDLILGVGVTDELERQNKRIISICRNKISGIIANFAVFVDLQHTKVLP